MEGSRGERKPTSWTARVIAPVVLVVVAGAIVVVITGSLSSDDDGSSKQSSAEQTTASGCSKDAEQALQDGYYVVQADDVEGLSGIADKTCTTTDELMDLNPNLDPQALQAENCVDLVPDGCKKLAGG